MEAANEAFSRDFVPTQERQQSILRERASRLAEEAVDEQGGDSLRVVVFTLAGETYGLESRFVSEAFDLTEITLIPGSARFLTGIINLRGTMMAVIDLKEFFELPTGGIEDKHKVLVVRKDSMELGLMADTLRGMIEVKMESMQTSLPTLTGIRSEYLKGITGEGVVILDVERILFDERIIVDET